MSEKNKVELIVTIEDCIDCPNMKMKDVEGVERMFCQTDSSLVCLKEGYGPRSIPDWCPRLKKNQPKFQRGLRAKIPGIVS
jgi:hypothetical protein